MSSKHLTQRRLREVIEYCAETGEFVWAVTKGRIVAGTKAASATSKGYRLICIDRIKHKAHRLAWLYVHGVMPSADIDHVNGDRSDNRICNLRIATRTQNNLNCGRRSDAHTRYRGVGFHKQRGKWRARLGKKHLGVYATEDEAHSAYLAEVERITVGQGFSVPRHPASNLIHEGQRS